MQQTTVVRRPFSTNGIDRDLERRNTGGLFGRKTRYDSLGEEGLLTVYRNPLTIKRPSCQPASQPSVVFTDMCPPGGEEKVAFPLLEFPDHVNLQAIDIVMTRSETTAG